MRWMTYWDFAVPNQSFGASNFRFTSTNAFGSDFGLGNIQGFTIPQLPTTNVTGLQLATRYVRWESLEEEMELVKLR